MSKLLHIFFSLENSVKWLSLGLLKHFNSSCWESKFPVYYLYVISHTGDKIPSVKSLWNTYHSASEIWTLQDKPAHVRMISTNGHVTIKLISLINNLSLSIEFLMCCRFHKWVTMHTAPEHRIVREKNLLPHPLKFIYIKLNTMHSFEFISLITCQHSLEMIYLYFYGWYT